MSDGNNKNEKKSPYSYHTFLFPFIWNNGGKVSIKEFEKILQVGMRWQLSDWRDRKIPENNSESDWLLDYAAYQYLTEPAANAIFNTSDNSVVHCYEYFYCNGKDAPERIADNGKFKYVITKGEKTYSLIINRIRLYLYNVGVGVIAFELENHDEKNLDAVNAINEYGRRVNLPYITPGKSHNLCADKISLEFDGKDFSTENFLEQLTDFSKMKKFFSLNYVMKPIQALLDGDGETISTKSDGDEKYYIKPCIDDRMFVCSLVADVFLSDEIKGVGKTDYSFLDGWDERMKKTGTRLNNKNENEPCCLENSGKSHDSYMLGWADESYLANRVYKFLFIENELTCQDIYMKRDLLLKSVYKRWLNSGTLYGVTHHSLCCITNTNVEESVIKPFLSQYVKLAILTVVQRSAMLAFFSECAMVSNRFDNDKVTSIDNLNSIETLLAKYVKAQNQLFLSELTSQEQGVEIYAKLREQLYIDRSKKELGEQMNNLRDVANGANERIERNSDDTLNKNLAWLSLAGILLAIVQDIPFILDNSFSVWQRVLGSLVAILLTGVGVIVFRKTLFARKRCKK